MSGGGSRNELVDYLFSVVLLALVLIIGLAAVGNQVANLLSRG
ncbi:MAG TPA: hypothetical protein VIA63_00910 [Candidatus Limnocylindria bacterium]|jgi:hypothetical protein